MRRANPDAASPPFTAFSCSNLLEPEVIVSVVDVREVLLLRAMPA
jgi:hypothetical protein